MTLFEFAIPQTSFQKSIAKEPMLWTREVANELRRAPLLPSNQETRLFLVIIMFDHPFFTLPFKLLSEQHCHCEQPTPICQIIDNLDLKSYLKL